MSRRALLAFEDLTLRFPGGGGVEGVDGTVGPPRVLGVVGPSGSGKSTFARLLAGYARPSRGHVRPPPRAHRPRRVQLVTQDPGSSFDPRLTLRASLASLPRAPVESDMASFGLPSGVLAHRPGELSGGQLQRLAVLRALAVSPDVLVLDEPTSALDPPHARALIGRVLCWLEEVPAGRRALVIVTHDLGQVFSRADHLLVFEGGRVVESGTPARVFGAPEAAVTQRLVSAARSLGRPLEGAGGDAIG